jgi:hypothetical protein
MRTIILVSPKVVQTLIPKLAWCMSLKPFSWDTLAPMLQVSCTLVVLNTILGTYWIERVGPIWGWWDPCSSSSTFLLAQANGCACVDFWCTLSIDGLFEVYPFNCWVSSQNMNVGQLTLSCLYVILFFWVVTYLFVSQGFISLWNVKKIHMTNF